MKKTTLCLLALITLTACTEDPPSTTPDVAPDMNLERDMEGENTPDVEAMLTIQPVSGSGVVTGTKFRAHIQVGRLVDVSPGK